MSKPLIELIERESGDWEVLKVKTDKADKEYSGHSIYTDIWLEILRDHFDCVITTKVISDKDMELRKY